MHRFLIAALLLSACAAPPPAPTTTAGVSHYTCPMHPSVHEQDPKAPCPICKMDLVAVTHDDLESGAVLLDPVRRQRYGVKTAAAAVQPLTREIRATGTLRWDTSRVYDVALRGDTWIERLHVVETGVKVKRGQSLATVYSPYLYAASREFLASRGSTREIEKIFRMKLLGIAPWQIEKLRKDGTVQESMEYTAPRTGYVVELPVMEGSHIKPGGRLARIASLEELWVEAEIFEDDLPHVKAGDEMIVEVQGRAEPTRVKVDRVEPWVDAKTRRSKVRANLDNEDGALLPNTYAKVTLRAPLGEHLAIPAEAVIHTGERRVVFVDVGGDQLVPRDIELGPRAGELVAVRGGLEAGDKVVVSSVFLVAAESRIRAAETYWAQAPKKLTQAASKPAPDPDKAVELKTAGLSVLPTSSMARPCPRRRSGSTATSYCFTRPPTVATSATPGTLVSA
jgi:Cu(I)/Ag(I) efflux system membrane fusion protein